MIFQRGNGALLKIDDDALAELDTYRQAADGAVEAGGVLLGRYLRDEPHVVVDAISPPHASDCGTRFSFQRSRRPHQRAINQAWRESGGTRVYLGEWHTHPEPDPYPSLVDLEDWRRRLRVDRVDSASLFFLIVGTTHIRLWEGFRSSEALAACTLAAIHTSARRNGTSSP